MNGKKYQKKNSASNKSKLSQNNLNSVDIGNALLNYELEVITSIPEESPPKDEPSNTSSKSSTEPFSDTDLTCRKEKLRYFTGHKYLRTDFTGLPFYREVKEMTPLKMVNLTSKNMKKSKFIIAPDGYVPNSEIRTLYPHLSIGDFVRIPERDLKKEKDDKLIQEIMEKHLSALKQIDARSIYKKKITKAKRKPRFTTSQNDLVALNNEVIDNFNFELEKAKSEISEDALSLKGPKIKKRKLRLPSVPKIRLSVKTEDLGPTKAPEPAEQAEGEALGTIDIDLLDKLERQIEEYDTYGNRDNKEVQKRILKDRLIRITDKELIMWLEKLEGVYGSKKEMYNSILLILNRSTEAMQELEKIIEDRQTRLGFLNTLTDPNHLFAFLLHFYNTKSDLLDDIQDALNGVNLSTVEKLISLCGQRYILEEFLSAFVPTKNYALIVLAEKFSNFTERSLILEKGLRGIYSENLIFNVFMSSKEDAEKFFQLILECRVAEMVAVIEQMKKISLLHEKFESTTISQVSKTESVMVLPTLFKEKIKTAPVTPADKTKHTSHSASELTRKHSVPPTIPSLPTYNEESWKIMMSQYLAQMISNIAPVSKGHEVDTQIQRVEDVTFQGLLKETSNMHHEVLRLLKVYLNNNLESAQKLLNGLVAEDDLAYQATIELIGEKEAMQIIKSMRLKQAKLIEKIMQLHGNEEEMNEARIICNSMLNNLPPALSKNLGKWLEAEKVDAKDVRHAFHVLTKTSETEGSTDDHLAVLDDVSKEFFSKPELRKNRFSIMESLDANFMEYTKSMVVKDDISKGYSEKLPLQHTRLSVGYKGLATEKDPTINTSSPITVETSIPAAKILDKTFSTFTSKSYTLSESKFVDKITRVKMKSEQKDKVYDSVSPSHELDMDDAEVFGEISEKDLTVDISERSLQSSKREESENQISDKIEIAEKLEHKYVETIKDLANSLNAETDLQKLQEIASEIIVVADSSKHHRESNVLLSMGIFEKLIDLLQEESKSEPTQDSSDSKKLTIKIEEKTPTVYPVIELGNKNLEEAIKISYIKQKKIEKYIEILKKLEIAEASEFEKLLKNKKNACSLYLPEMQNQMKILSDMGFHCFQPFQIISSRVDTIIRETQEENIRRRVSSVKRESADKSELKYYNPAMPTPLQDFMDKIGTDIFDLTSREKDISSGSLEKVLSISVSDVEEILMPKISDEKIIIPEKPPYYLKDPLSLKSMQLDAEIFQPKIEGEEDDIFVHDERSIEYELREARPFKLKGFIRQQHPSNPYNDFRKIYGPSAFYLPFISPIVLKKVQSGEEEFPSYYETDAKKTNSVFSNLQRLFNRKDPEAACNLFKKAHFLRRPSNLPLDDWIKLGAPGMASNMTITDKHYKTTGSRCRFQHLAKLNFHKYGLSSANHINRVDLIEYITKANTSFTTYRLKAKLENKRQAPFKSSSSTETLINSN